MISGEQKTLWALERAPDTRMPENSKIRLSPSSLNLFLECPRCFWLDKNKGIKRPRGIFPSLPSGMDSVIKKYTVNIKSSEKIEKKPLEKEGFRAMQKGKKYYIENYQNYIK